MESPSCQVLSNMLLACKENTGPNYTIANNENYPVTQVTLYGGFVMFHICTYSYVHMFI